MYHHLHLLLRYHLIFLISELILDQLIIVVQVLVEPNNIKSKLLILYYTEEKIHFYIYKR